MALKKYPDQDRNLAEGIRTVGRLAHFFLFDFLIYGIAENIMNIRHVRENLEIFQKEKSIANSVKTAIIPKKNAGKRQGDFAGEDRTLELVP